MRAFIFSLLFGCGLLLNAQDLRFKQIDHYKSSIRGTANIHGSFLTPKNQLFTVGRFGDTIYVDPRSNKQVIYSNVPHPFITVQDSLGNFIRHMKIVESGGNCNPSNLVPDQSFEHFYVAGDFNGKVDFDPDTGTHYLSYSDGKLFVAKYSIDGRLIWAHNFGGIIERTYFNSITLDNEQNLLFYFNTMGRKVDFDPGPDSAFLENDTVYHMAVVKLDSAGKYIWHKAWATNVSSILNNRVKVAPNNNIIFTGNFALDCDFDPGPGTHILSSYYNKSIFSEDQFILCLDSSGQFEWVKQIRIEDSDNPSIVGLVIDQHNQIYFSGSCKNRADIDPGPDSIWIGEKDKHIYYIGKLDSKGNYIWHEPIDCYGSLRDHLSLDKDGHLVAIGSFFKFFNMQTDTTFDSLSNKGLTDIFLLALDTNGRHLWSGHLGSKALENILSVYYDSITNQFFLSGGFSNGPLDIDPSLEQELIQPNANITEAFLLKLDNKLTLKSNWDTLAFCPWDTALIASPYPTINNRWSTESKDSQIIADSAGYYHVEMWLNHNYLSDTFFVYFDSMSIQPLLPTDTGFCKGDSILIKTPYDTTEYKHLWSTGSKEESIVIDTANTFHVKVTSRWGCGFNDSLSTYFYPEVPNFDVGPDIKFCEGDSMQVSSGLQMPTYTYVWNDNYNTDTLTVKNADTFILVVENTLGCKATDSLVVTLDSLPPLSLDSIVEFCIGDSFEINTGLNAAKYLINWNNGSTQPEIKSNKEGKFVVTATSFRGCKITDSTFSREKPLPKVYVGPDTAFCGLFQYQINAEGDSIINYKWNTGEETKFIIAQQAGEYFVKVKNDYNCSSADTTDVSKLAVPNLTIAEDSLFMTCDQNLISITAQTQEQKTVWNTGEAGKQISVADTGWYSVKVAIPFCTVTDSVYVSRYCPEGYKYPDIIIPTAFTPGNLDALNPVFRPTINGEVFDYHFRIYNRWGEKLFESFQVDEGWTGLSKNQILPPDTYIYILTFKYSNGATDYRSGHFFLLR